MAKPKAPLPCRLQPHSHPPGQDVSLQVPGNNKPAVHRAPQRQRAHILHIKHRLTHKPLPLPLELGRGVGEHPARVRRAGLRRVRP